MLELNRRAFLQSLGGGLLILCEAGAQESGRGGGRERLPENVGAWLHIARDGSVTGFTGKVEVGQNIRTSLTQAVADELRCAPKIVNLVMGDTSLVAVGRGNLRQPHDAYHGARHAKDGSNGERSLARSSGKSVERRPRRFDGRERLRSSIFGIEENRFRGAGGQARLGRRRGPRWVRDSGHPMAGGWNQLAESKCA